MNAGKTLAATSLLHGLKAAGFRVAGIKATGTGSGGDLWIMRDAGADLVLDFTDAGFASTYLAPIAELEAATLRLIDHAAMQACDVAVIEIADGLQQQETAALIRSSALRRRTAGVVFSAYDAMGATYGVDTLRALGHRVIGLSGRLARSPLAVREAELATGLRVYTPWELQAGALVEYIASEAQAVAPTAALRPRCADDERSWSGAELPCMARDGSEAERLARTRPGRQWLGSAALPRRSRHHGRKGPRP